MNPRPRILEMMWTCKCGHRGLDRYEEHQPEAIQALANSLHEAGFHVSLKLREAERTTVTDIPVYYTHVINFLHNFLLQLIWSQISSVTRVGGLWRFWYDFFHTRNEFPEESSNGSFKGVGNDLAAGPSGTQNTIINSNLVQNTSTQSAPAGPSTTRRYTGTNTHTPPPGGHTTASGIPANSVAVQIPEDFILLCVQVQKYFIRRHDLAVPQMWRDKHLFTAFRNEYLATSRWMYRRFSLYTVQRIKFVKFKLLQRYEIDALEPGLPPITESHYAYDPRPPGLVPPIGNNILMHRFNSPKECYTDDICLKQIPKRINERPTPGLAPDLHTGWGMYLEEGLDMERICALLLAVFVTSGIFGLIWGICRRSLQDGFTVAGFIASGEAVAVAGLQLLLVARTIE
ncbi:hypothetical protein NX059_001792 [Plenodomus lindquistii]|nr:hypothetical protein NX059_001792 [Plenodomus lindquistii]